MSKTRCYKCEGKGWVREPIDWLPAIFTFGLTALVQKSFSYECKSCNGLGYLEEQE